MRANFSEKCDLSHTTTYVSAIACMREGERGREREGERECVCEKLSVIYVLSHLCRMNVHFYTGMSAMYTHR